MLQFNESEIRNSVVERFTRYAKIHTTSNSGLETIPSSAGQSKLADILTRELKDMGIESVRLTENSYVIARPGHESKAPDSPAIGFLAHLDTSEDSSGENVNPVIHKEYKGGRLTLPSGLELNGETAPELSACTGSDIITSDGHTLLGADDKAGIAEIMTAVELLVNSGEKLAPLTIIFNPDEETGRGMSKLPVDELSVDFCYTIDGSGVGEIEAECFNAYKVTAEFTGNVIHPGYGRGKFINAVTMASKFVSMIPANETPVATDGDFGNYWPAKINGSMERTQLKLFIRDFEEGECQRRLKALESYARAVEAAFPGGKVSLKWKKQYSNMAESISKHPHILEYARQAMVLAGIEPVFKKIRGGTDGSRLSEMGIPTPNLSAGGHNFHSKLEWIPVDAMVSCVKVICNIASLVSEK